MRHALLARHASRTVSRQIAAHETCYRTAGRRYATFGRQSRILRYIGQRSYSMREVNVN